MSSDGARVPIQGSVKKMIQDIKEVAGNHGEDEIHAMLMECNLDPNETVQKLLSQDPFHEVKKKHGRRKEVKNLNNRDPLESRRRADTQWRVGSKVGRTNFTPRYPLRDAGGITSSDSGRNVEIKQIAKKDMAISHEIKMKETTPPSSLVSVLSNRSEALSSRSTTFVGAPTIASRAGADQPKQSSSAENKKLETLVTGTRDNYTQLKPNSSYCSVAVASVPSSNVCFSSELVLVPSNGLRVPAAVDTIQIPSEQHFDMPVINKSRNKVGKSQLTKPSQPLPTLSPSKSLSSNDSDSPQQIIGPVVSSKEWTLKSTKANTGQGSATSTASDVPTLPSGNNGQSQPLSNALDLQETTSKLQKKPVLVHLPQGQKHVIIPNHIHVPESERTNISFGSFDANSGVNSSHVITFESEKSSKLSPETSQVVEETLEKQASSDEIKLATSEEGDYPDHHPQSSSQVPVIFSGGSDVSTRTSPDSNGSKQETVLISKNHQYAVVNSQHYDATFMPPILASQIGPSEHSDTQTHDVSRLPNFVVQQPLDLASYYGQFYRSGVNTDGRISPFTPIGVAHKYEATVAALPPQSSQPSNEDGNSTASPTSTVTQATVTQQPLSVVHQAAGIISHFSTNYAPYGHYFSPVYVPHPFIHQFLNNGAFPQHPQASSVYPASPAPATTGVKYSLPLYKPGNNTGNTTPNGMLAGYGLYGSTPAGYKPISAPLTGNTTANEDLSSSQLKESNVYITGQTEGSTVWIPAPGRDMSNLSANMLYNISHSQHVTFAPTQASHVGAFAGMYHPGQAATVQSILQQTQSVAGAVDTIRPTTTVYQQPPLHPQMNWPSQY